MVSPLCTFFASAKPFIGKARTAQYNALGNWQALGLPVILLGDDEGVAEAAEAVEALHIPAIAKTVHGTPLLSDIFEKAQQAATTPLVCYINADILLPPSFLTALQAAVCRWAYFLMIGQRWDVDVASELSFDGGWPARLESLRRERGRLHGPWGLDYFVFPRGMVRSMLPFAIGRPGWDGWLIWSQSARGTPLLNATAGVPALHQNHDYGHVPNGRHNTHAGPEGDANLRLLLDDAPDFNPIYASTFRAEWVYGGETIALDDSWRRWWWFTKYRLKPACLVKEILRCFLGEKGYARLKKLAGKK
jgi:hypothetical protein